MRQKDNYVMDKQATPKQVVLPDSRTFVASYDRVSRDCLAPNITIRRRYRQTAAPRNRRRCQRGRGFFSFIKKSCYKPSDKSAWEGCT